MIKKGHKHILIINQHGENRGDESAMRAMISTLESSLNNVRFTAIVQFRDKALPLFFEQDVRLLHMVMPLVDALCLGFYGIGFRLGANFPFLLSKLTRPIIEAFKTADMVISAPGGPYFGDIYASHELVHWFYVWLATVYKKPLFLYSPSAGPFNIKPLNIVRRHFYRKFGVLCTRESISKKHLLKLLGSHSKVHLTADSALQETPAPFNREQYFTPPKSYLEKKFIVAVSAIQYKYPKESNPAAKQKEYDAVIVQCLHYLNGLRDCHFMFFPQLHGTVHSDVRYLEYIAKQMKPSVSWEIVDPEANSNIQRRLFGMADFCIASRYHPQIFAASAGVPGICIYYEHKALGFMQALDMADFAFDIRKLDVDRICSRIDQIIGNHSGCVEKLSKNIVPIQKLSKNSTLLASEYFYADKRKF